MISAAPFLLALAQGPSPLTEEERILHLLSRFTPGPTAALVEEVRAKGWREWLAAQLAGGGSEADPLETGGRAFESLALRSAEIFERYDRPVPEDLPEERKRELRRARETPPRELLTWVLLRAVHGRHPVREVACDFFRNHFAVSLEKDDVRLFALPWERDVIRRGCLGRFGDLLASTARHPAMLVFLDNHVSRRPPSDSELKQLGRRTRKSTGSAERAREAVDIARQRGLNENYARELLELHTLGVDNGYTQRDVVEVGKCLTGWTVRRSGEGSQEFEFNAEMHSTDRKSVLGASLSPRRDTEEGDAVLQMLARHPGTARFLAWKLCRWLVNDDPDDEMVQRVAGAFRREGGDLAKVFRAIAEDPEFAARRNYRAKFKRPFEFVVSALRACGAEIAEADGLLFALAAMNEPLYRCADPTGYYDQAEAWGDAGALATRWTFAFELAAGRIPGVRLPPSLFADLPPDRPREWKEILARRILPVAGLDPETSANLDALVARELRRGRRPPPGRLEALLLAALLGSPEFQRQ